MPDGRVELEDRARSTRENALLTLPLARPRPGERWLLVTSAMHMPRSIGVFRRAGWPELQPWPVDYRTTGGLDLAWRAQHGCAAGRARSRRRTSGTGLALLSPARLHRRHLPGRAVELARRCRLRATSCAGNVPIASWPAVLAAGCAARAAGQGAVRRRRRARAGRRRRGVIGSYAKGCLAGGAALPVDGPAWQAMRLSRNRVWGHPALIAFVERLALGCARRRLAGPPGRRHGPAARRADAHRPRLAPDRARRRPVADADARPAAERATEREIDLGGLDAGCTARAPSTRRGSPTPTSR